MLRQTHNVILPPLQFEERVTLSAKLRGTFESGG
jgi:hypothetical protein